MQSSQLYKERDRARKRPIAPLVPNAGHRGPTRRPSPNPSPGLCTSRTGSQGTLLTTHTVFLGCVVSSRAQVKAPFNVRICLRDPRDCSPPEGSPQYSSLRNTLEMKRTEDQVQGLHPCPGWITLSPLLSAIPLHWRLCSHVAL